MPKCQKPCPKPEEKKIRTPRGAVLSRVESGGMATSMMTPIRSNGYGALGQEERKLRSRQFGCTADLEKDTCDEAVRKEFCRTLYADGEKCATPC
ncbi:hypothetical protein HPB50_018243 [Hyalomma asiaticum]|uniref:Uncharacterized protein n=1 Tax=Hyalomma asiaticum TaxID=266040 RepID=A0ACB7STQ5_HYAAI|nr:hypothetical protein HPB50_018243 [Hyalomma asiaticum]